MFKELNASKALVIGAGGGNDIVSSILVAQYLKRMGVKADIAGMLSPGAMHSFNGTLEQVINRIDGEVKRWIPAREAIPIPFIDAHLPSLSQAMLPDAEFYDFSCRFGTQALIDSVKSLVQEKGYDLVIGVDVGGDIFGRPIYDKTLLSPMMDFTTLFLLRNLDVQTRLVEFGLLTDGELRPDSAREIIDSLNKHQLLSQSQIAYSDPEVQAFANFFKQVKKIRPGRTIPMLLKGLKKGSGSKEKYRFTSQIGKQKWVTKFDVEIPDEFIGQVYVLNPDYISSDCCFAYENILDQYLRIKRAPHWKTELDLLYLYSGSDFKTTGRDGELIMMLAPSLQIPKKQREKIVNAGMKHMNKGQADLCLVLGEDFHKVRKQIKGYLLMGRFALVCPEGKTDALMEIGEKMDVYLKH